jgi:hypothetical protein
MRKIFVLGIILILFFSSFSVYAANITNNTNDIINNTTADNKTVIINESRNNRTVYVSTNGKDSNNGLTKATSKKSIQNAIDTVSDGGTVNIKSGTYHENIKINKNVSLIGMDKNVKIDGDFKDSCIIIGENYSVSLEKLTIQRAWNTGLINHGKTNITHVTVKNNAAENNGGILNTGTMSIQNSKIIDNTIKNENAGICNRGNLTINNSEINNNQAGSNCGGIYIERKGTIQNSKINHNKVVYDGAGLYNDGDVIIIDSQLNDNTGEGCGGCLINHSELTIIKSEISGNTADIKAHLFRGETIYTEGGE